MTDRETQRDAERVEHILEAAAKLAVTALVGRRRSIRFRCGSRPMSLNRSEPPPQRRCESRQPASTGRSRPREDPTRNLVVRLTTRFQVSQAAVDGARRRDPRTPVSRGELRPTALFASYSRGGTGSAIPPLNCGFTARPVFSIPIRFLLASNSRGVSVQRRGRGQQRPNPSAPCRSIGFPKGASAPDRHVVTPGFRSCLPECRHPGRGSASHSARSIGCSVR